MMNGRSDGRTVGRRHFWLALASRGLHSVFRSITPTGVFPGTMLCGFRKKESLNVPKKKKKMNINNITNKQTNLKDFANWKGGAGKDPNAPGKTPMRQETVQNLTQTPS